MLFMVRHLKCCELKSAKLKPACVTSKIPVVAVVCCYAVGAPRGSCGFVLSAPCRSPMRGMPEDGGGPRLMLELSRLAAKGKLGQILILGQQIIQAARHD